MYADDTVVYTSISKNPTLTEIQNYQQEINNIALWCHNNKLSINTDKTKLMILGTNKRSKNVTLPVNITINDNTLELTETYKYLGVSLNSQLTFKEHINSCIGLTASKINVLVFLKKYVSCVILLKVYKTNILPILEYANVLDPLVPKQLLIKKQRSQNRALRIIFKQQQSINKLDLHRKAKLATLHQRADKQILCNFYKRSLKPDKYPQLDNTGITRLNLKIRFNMPMPTIERFKQFTTYYGMKLWDELPKETQMADSYLSFKNRVLNKPDFIKYPI